MMVLGLILILLGTNERIAWRIDWSPVKLFRFSLSGGLIFLVGFGLMLLPGLQNMRSDRAEVDLPTPLPDPFISINAPKETLTCTVRRGICRFEILGIAGGVFPLGDYQIYTLVYQLEPRGPGYYLQRPSTFIDMDGSWKQAHVSVGNAKLPVTAGSSVRIQAMLVDSDASFDGTPLRELPAEFYFGSTKSIEGMIAISDIVDLSVVDE